MLLGKKNKRPSLLALALISVQLSCGILKPEKKVDQKNLGAADAPLEEDPPELAQLALLTVSLGPDLTLTADAALRETFLLLSPSLGGATLYGTEGYAWRFADESKRWQALDQVTGFDGEIYNVNDQTIWLITGEKISVASYTDLSSGKDILISFAPKDYRLVGLSNSGAVFVAKDIELGRILWLRQEADLNFNELILPWVKDDGLVLSAIGSEDGTSLTVASETRLNVYALEEDKLLLSKSLRLELKGLTGTAQFMRLSGDFLGEEPEITLAQVVTEQGVFSSLYPPPEDGDDGNPALTWSEDIRPIAVEFCKKCHYAGSGRVWEKGDDENSWKEKKQAIIQQISSRAMPPSSDVTGTTITDLQRGKFVDWLEAQP